MWNWLNILQLQIHALIWPGCYFLILLVIPIIVNNLLDSQSVPTCSSVFQRWFDVFQQTPKNTKASARHEHFPVRWQCITFFLAMKWGEFVLSADAPLDGAPLLCTRAAAPKPPRLQSAETGFLLSHQTTLSSSFWLAVWLLRHVSIRSNVLHEDTQHTTAEANNKNVK